MPEETHESGECYFCGNSDVTEDDFCHGCGNHICEECCTASDTPMGAHFPEDHQEADDE